MKPFTHAGSRFRWIVTTACFLAFANPAANGQDFCDTGICVEPDVCCDTMAWDDDCDGCGKALTCRQRWANNGITLSNNLTQFYFGTASGGIEETDRFGGHGDYVANFDFGKLGIQEGLFLKVRAEHRFGESITEATGALFPATLAADLPVADSRNLYVTNFVLTQALSESFILFAGKVDTLDGDANAFASGRGISQFSNIAMVANPIALRTIPYSSLGAGFAFLKDGEPLFSFLVINPTDTTNPSGLSELFAEGVAFSSELRVPTNFLNRSGHQLVGATYSTREFVSLDQDPRIVLPQVPVARAGDSWSLYWNMDQYLVTDRSDPSRGWGFFARAGIADDRTNPISSFYSVGLGGNSMFGGRDQDTFGVGYYRSETSDQIGPAISAVLGGIGEGQGVEAFYNLQATQSLTITPDAQWISQARQSVNDAYVLGVRANFTF